MQSDNVAELLGRLTDQPSQSIHQLLKWGQTSGGAFQGLSQADIAYCTAGLPPLAAQTILVKYAEANPLSLQAHLVDVIEQDALQSVARVPLFSSWKPTRSHWTNDLVRLAIVEHISHKVCPRCQSRGKALINSRLEFCFPCQGTGRARWTHETRSRDMDVPRDTWIKWAKRYEAIQGLLLQVEYVALGIVSRRLA